MLMASKEEKVENKENELPTDSTEEPQNSPCKDLVQRLRDPCAQPPFQEEEPPQTSKSAPPNPFSPPRFTASQISLYNATHFHRLERCTALNKVFSDIKTKAIMIRDNILNDTVLDGKSIAPYSLFSWFSADFEERRKIKGTIWIDIFRRQNEGERIENRKTRADLDHILKFVGLLTSMVCGDKNDVYELLEDAKQHLSIEERLKEEQKKNNEELQAYVRDVTAMGISQKRDERRHKLLLEIEEKLINSDILNPIDTRFQIRHMEANVEDFLQRFNVDNKDLEKEIAAIERKKTHEVFRSQCTLDSYYIQIESYRSRIRQQTEAYDYEYQTLHETISRKKLAMEKLRARRHYLQEQIARFHEEIEHMHMREKAQREREERIAEEARLLAEQEAAAKLARRKARARKAAQNNPLAKKAK